MTSTISGDLFKCALEKRDSDLAVRMADARMNDELDRPALFSSSDLCITDDSFVALFARHESCKSCASTLDEIEPFVLSERSVIVDALSCPKQSCDRRDVLFAHAAFDLDKMHLMRVPAARRIMGQASAISEAAARAFSAHWL